SARHWDCKVRGAFFRACGPVPSRIRPGERVCELIRMFVEAPRDSFVSRVEPQGEVRGQHGWRVTLRRVVRIRNRAGACATLRFPLLRAGRAFRPLPLVAEQVLEVVRSAEPTSELQSP